jgi:predicted transcriptional regulator
MSLRLADDVEQQLVSLAKATGRTKSWLASQAIQDFVAREVWQVAEIERAIREADEGDFVSAEYMAAKFKAWGVNAG